MVSVSIFPSHVATDLLTRNPLQVHWATQSEEEEETEQLTPSEEILGANSRHTLPIDEDQVTMR